MKKKIKVLVFTSSFRIGGSERQAVELVKRLDRSRFELFVACFQNNGPLLDELPDGLKVDAFPLTSFFNTTAVCHAARFLKLLRQKRVQVVQCFDFYSNVFAIPTARLAGVPVILGSRRDEAVMRTGRQQMAERWCYGLATGVIANAEAIKDQLVSRAGLPPAKVWVVHNGLDLDRFDHQGSLSREELANRNHRVTIAVVANLRPEKGHLIFLEAAHCLAKVYSQASFVIVGDGPMRKTIETRVRELGLTGRVKVPGAVNDIPSFLRSVDIAVLPALKNEGLPNAVMEAMAAGLPVVATDTGGTRELVVDGLTGYLVQPRDWAALADCLGRLCDDSETRRKMGEAGRLRIVERFSADRMANGFAELYSNLVDEL